MDAKIVLGGQQIVCSVKLSSQNENTYEGRLTEAISDVSAAEFWSAYDHAVNEMLLVEVDKLEKRLVCLPFFIIVDGERFHAADVDLQIYPSSGRLSFTVASEEGQSISLCGE
jgi:hypothetical protein